MHFIIIIIIIITNVGPLLLHLHRIQARYNAEAILSLRVRRKIFAWDGLWLWAKIPINK